MRVVDPLEMIDVQQQQGQRPPRAQRLRAITLRLHPPGFARHQPRQEIRVGFMLAVRQHAVVDDHDGAQRQARHHQHAQRQIRDVPDTGFHQGLRGHQVQDVGACPNGADCGGHHRHRPHEAVAVARAVRRHVALDGDGHGQQESHLQQRHRDDARPHPPIHIGVDHQHHERINASKHHQMPRNAKQHQAKHALIIGIQRQRDGRVGHHDRQPPRRRRVLQAERKKRQQRKQVGAYGFFDPRHAAAGQRPQHTQGQHSRQRFYQKQINVLRVDFTMVMAEAIIPPTSDMLAGRISVLPSLATLPNAST
ncbi:hypothetical protein G6F50_013983 [Rhizopus delemar]|uniref:Uncharacterized protein n=1 Tax=Rhizopus delemar TaxID=936053 RepID=A0A9P7CAJ2_9FUNG|nr:hypothetical protein G6F50_013983 [Rhizopus delemar]